MTHLDCILSRLRNERERLLAATNPKEIELRKVWVEGIENELEREYKFLGITPEDTELSLDEILAELT